MSLASRISRRAALRTIALGGSAALIVACGQPPAPAKPAAQPTPAAPAAPAAQPTSPAKPAADAKPTSAPAAKTDGPKRGGQLTVGSSLDLTSIDPQANTGSQHISTLWLEALTSIAEDGKLIPHLADSWEISPDGTQYTFKLRPGVTFHNGKPLTAQDVKYTVERTIDPNVGAAQRPNLLDVGGVDAVDQQTVRLTLKQPYGPLLAALAEVWIVPEGSAGADGKIAQPIGTGPFQYVSWTSGKETVVKRYDKYWQPDLPYLDGIVVKMIVDDTTRLAALRSGEIQMMQGIPLEQVEPLRSSGLRFEPMLDPSTWTLGFNLHQPQSPVDKLEVRKAIALVLDKQEVLAARVRNSGIGMTSHQPSSKGELWHLPDLPDPFPKPDLDKAKQLFAQAGVSPAGLKLVLPGNIETQRLTEVVAGQLRRVGIEPVTDIVERTATRARMDKFDWHLAVNVTGPRTDPAQKYVGWYSQGGGSFRPNLPDVDEVYLRAVRLTDTEARRKAWGEMWTLVQDKHTAAVTICHDNNTYAFADKLQGFRPGRTFHLHWAQGGLGRVWLSS